ncbi:hypothetical protein KIL84_004301 [Mauremys mutica]|uniref:Uncharacterized protein n=1 Tax=Mauremys mutica TaxID=74926 RepID=A0A9D3XLI2_9SAUR|nr:hypothetical protein KIL84_004301 [Mauremys mutica]
MLMSREESSASHHENYFVITSLWLWPHFLLEQRKCSETWGCIRKLAKDRKWGWPPITEDEGAHGQNQSNFNTSLVVNMIKAELNLKKPPAQKFELISHL